jgi:DNA polymerase-3 subunit epsilon
MTWFKRFQKETIPEEFADYATALAENDFGKQALNNARFVVLDTETTGLDPKKDRILSIGAIAVYGNTIDVSDSFEVFVKQDFVKNESISIHEITPGEAAKAVDAKQALSAFIHYLSGSVIIGHYVDFDFNILSESCLRNLGFKLKNKRYDTMQLLKRTDNHFAYSNLHKAEDLNLENVCKRYHLPISDRHTAIGDAMATALLFARQLKKLEHRGVRTVGELLKR